MSMTLKMGLLVLEIRKFRYSFGNSSPLYPRNTLIICDPAIRRIRTDPSGTRGYNVATSPHNGGYPDFSPHRDQTKNPNGPPHTSFLDDISFYLCHHLAKLDLHDPLCPLWFIENIIASHYTKTVEFVDATLEKMQYNLSRRDNMSQFKLTDVEEQWSDIQAWDRRIAEFKNDLYGIMLQLRHTPSDLAFDHPKELGTSGTNYRFLLLRLTEIGQRVQSVSTSVAAVVSMTASRTAMKVQELSLQMADQSVREAKNVRALTILGLVFIPFAYTSSLFSMAERYAPGGDLFWVYFVVSFPLLGLSTLGYSMLKRPGISGLGTM
ncbi:hypothetical protein GGR57DRAFT_509264 [Xylariaceae sp. FL1272]|nr:hypothetical protein GGR57DRAFT_509264 [Xylariaceae sp. FL1272]